MRVDFARSVIKPQLVIALALHFLALDTGKIFIARKRTYVTKRGRRSITAINLRHYDWLVRVTAQEVDNHFVTYARQRNRTPLIAGPTACNAYPGRVSFGIAGAGILRMAVILWPGAGEAHFDTSKFVTVNFLSGGAYHQGTLQSRIRQVFAWIKRRNNWNIPAHA